MAIALSLRAGLVALVLAAGLAGGVGKAWADADPPSDVLGLQNVYLPYQPKVAPPLAKRLQALADGAKRAGYPLKVAIVATPADLGGIADQFGNPQRYAGFLASEIAYNASQPLLVVMPTGLGLNDAGDRAFDAVKGIRIPRHADANALARVAIAAVPRLAAAAGHPISSLDSGGSGSGGGGANLWLIFGAPALLAVIVIALTARRRERAA